MYRILRHGSHIPALPNEYSRVFPHPGMKFRHTSYPLSCWGCWSQTWHRLQILFTGQLWQATTHYSHMIPLQADLRTVYTHFALLLNDSFCSIQSIFSPSWILWICGCQHTPSVIFQTLNLLAQAWLIPLGLSAYLNQYLISMWRPPLNCHNYHAPCQPILWREVSATRLL